MAVARGKGNQALHLNSCLEVFPQQPSPPLGELQVAVAG